MRLLIVEDEKRMAELLRRGFEEEDFQVSLAHDGRSGLEMGLDAKFDLIVLDVMLPGLDGFEVARRLRAEGVRTPILMLTARDAVPDIVAGLNIGADDYLTKPFSFQVLLARVRAVARRGQIARPAKFQVGDLDLDPACHEVLRAGVKIELTKTEFALLEALIRRAGQVVPRNALIEDVWGFDKEVESNTLDAFIRLLRSKIDSGGRPKLIHTVRGIGYSLRAEEPS